MLQESRLQPSSDCRVIHGNAIGCISRRFRNRLLQVSREVESFQLEYIFHRAMVTLNLDMRHLMIEGTSDMGEPTLL
jgi:hypothetical protein